MVWWCGPNFRLQVCVSAALPPPPALDITASLFAIYTPVRPPTMDQLPQDNDPRRDHPFVEKGVVSEVAVLISPDGNSDEFTKPYRLYRRRWIGVFAMVSTPFLVIYCS